MLDVLIGGDKLAGNLIAPTNSPARSYSAFSPARLPTARAAHAGLFDRAASAHSTPAPTGLCSPSRRPPFATSAPESTAAWRPCCLASVRRRVASAHASLPRFRLPSHGLARASPPSRLRQLLLAGCTVGYRACPFAYPSSRSAHLLRLLQPPCAPLLSCPTRISKVSNTRDAPRDEGKREEAQRPRDKTHGDEGEDVHAAGLLITQEPAPARDIAILPSCPSPTVAATTLPGHMTSLRTFVPQGPRCRATRALRRRSEQRSEWWTGTNDSTSSTMDWPASLAFSASDPTILGLSYNFYPIESNPISSKVNGCPYPI